MSAEIIWNQKNGEEKKEAHPDALINLNVARDFYKTHFFSKEWNFSMTVKNDSRENILIWIGWTPPAETEAI